MPDKAYIVRKYLQLDRIKTSYVYKLTANNNSKFKINKEANPNCKWQII